MYSKSKQDRVWVIGGADRDTQIADGKVGFRNVLPMPEARAATAEGRIRARLIVSALGKSMQCHSGIRTRGCRRER
jgi:hypothetical protein